LGDPTEPPRAYYHSSWDRNSDLRCCVPRLWSPGSGDEHDVDAPRAKRTEIANMEVISLQNKALPVAAASGAQLVNPVFTEA
jgi:hypothetical protein